MLSLIERWFKDLKIVIELVIKPSKAKFSFPKEIRFEDKLYAALLIVLSLWPAAVILSISTLPKIQKMAQFFGAPMHAIVVGAFMVIVIMLGLKLNKVNATAVTAIHLTLRLMAVYPILAFLKYSIVGSSIILVIYGILVPLAVVRTFKIYPRNAFIFYSIFYIVLGIIQLKTILR